MKWTFQDFKDFVNQMESNPEILQLKEKLMYIQRYTANPAGDFFSEDLKVLEENSFGEWVKYSDIEDMINSIK